MFISLYFSCPHKHVFNRKKKNKKKQEERNGGDYIDQIRIVATACIVATLLMLYKSEFLNIIMTVMYLFIYLSVHNALPMIRSSESSQGITCT